jgi:hypothetical protein
MPYGRPNPQLQLPFCQPRGDERMDS